MRLSQLSLDERPREKLLERGPESLSVIELLAILMRTGTNGKDVLEFSASILDKWGGLDGLCRASAAELMQEKGLKEAKVTTLLTVIELGKRISLINFSKRNTWKKKLNEIAQDTKFLDRENIFALFLDAKDRVIEEETISYGGQSGAYMDIPVFYRKAVRLNAFSVLLVHNHPDGSLYASREDIALTENIRQGLKILGIRLKGHYIAANGDLTQVP
ncbi:MAG: DNA repair protein RadC [Synergistaceae bacterium]|nr:DNA repair protein RadC [Synergistaceae bacterium]